MNLPIGQLIKIIIDDTREPLLAVITKDLGSGTYELTRSTGNKIIKDVITYEEFVYNFSSGHFKLVLD
tara:strand:- start:263 stop:466 length:204 start_codon:yes stop_codon:yes gene_type:complete